MKSRGYSWIWNGTNVPPVVGTALLVFFYYSLFRDAFMLIRGRGEAEFFPYFLALSFIIYAVLRRKARQDS
jgi:hypothetical protein